MAPSNAQTSIQQAFDELDELRCTSDADERDRLLRALVLFALCDDSPSAKRNLLECAIALFPDIQNDLEKRQRETSDKAKELLKNFSGGDL